MIALLSDLEMIIHKFPDRPDLRIYPVSDVHFGASEHMTRAWEQFCQSLMAQENAYVILGGDLINNATRNSVSNVFEETLRPREQKKVMTKMLEPIKSRILCMVSGNHERRSLKDADDDPSYDIACKLDIENLYRENVAFVKIQMGDPKADGNKNPTYVLTVTHGAGGGGTTGASVNRSEKYAGVIEGLDLLVTGHTHKPSVTPPFRLVTDPRSGKVYMRHTHVVVCSSWMDYGGYAMEKMMPPSGYIKQRILIGGRKKSIEVIM